MAEFTGKNLFGDSDRENIAAGHIISVVFNTGADSEFDYLVPDSLWPIQPGSRIKAPFGRGNRPQVGFCVAAEPACDLKTRKYRLKAITAVTDPEPLLDDHLLELGRWISEYYICPLGQVLAAMVPAAVKRGAGTSKTSFVYLPAKSEELFNLRGQKQKRLVEILHETAAFTNETAIERGELLKLAACTAAPLKKLANEQLVKITKRVTLKALPAVPDGLLVRKEIVDLNDQQRNALSRICEKINENKFAVTLLHGVTDSGKTEIYIRAIERVVNDGKGAIVLLPEIALTAQTVQRFRARFKNIAVLHSALTDAQRNFQWQLIKSGAANVVIGARSAVFAPLNNLGLIVVDEEHENSFKQDTVPRYHGRDVAIKRAQLAGGHCILGTSTPSLEMLYNCTHKGHFQLVKLTKRVLDLPMPEMKLVDMRQEKCGDDWAELISKPLGDQLNKVLAKGEQAILLLNRRGYSSFIFCPGCGHTVGCKNCDVSLTFHKTRRQELALTKSKYVGFGYARCHYCFSQTLVPRECPLCGRVMRMVGLGAQKLEEEVGWKFPNAKLARIDSDSMRGKDYYKLLADFAAGRIDILAGTQMLAKGLHFPNVTLVGIVSADTALCLPDFRANERTFQLISQVAGRTGRSEKKGLVFVQTFKPGQAAIVYAMNYDYDGFVRRELHDRKQCNWPPGWRLAVILLRDAKFDRVDDAGKALRARIDSIVRSEGLDVVVQGPVPPGIARMQGFHRMQIVVQSPSVRSLQRLFSQLRQMGTIRPAVRVAIDIDPVNLL